MQKIKLESTSTADPYPFKEWRSNQEEAIVSARESLVKGKNVILSAPTGAGKSLINFKLAEGAKQDAWAYYIVSTKGLQDQIEDTFGDMVGVLKGRSNYSCLRGFRNAGECPRAVLNVCPIDNKAKSCYGCPNRSNCECVQLCPYEIAKREALRSPILVTNFQMFLTAPFFKGEKRKRDILIIDEAQNIEKAILSHASVNFREDEIDISVFKNTLSEGKDKNEMIMDDVLPWMEDQKNVVGNKVRALILEYMKFLSDQNIDDEDAGFGTNDPIIKECCMILGITISSGIAGIKKAYRRLALKHHPDTSKSSNTADKFIVATEAYNTLLAYPELAIQKQGVGEDQEAKPKETKGKNKWSRYSKNEKDEEAKKNGDKLSDLIRRIKKEKRIFDSIRKLLWEYKERKEIWIVGVSENYDRRKKEVITSLVFEPITMSPFLSELFGKGRNFVLSSATPPLPEELGEYGKDIRTIELPSTFPVENRPIYLDFVGKMGVRYRNKTIPKMAAKIDDIADDQTIVHCHSYKIASEISKHLKNDHILQSNRDGDLDEFKKGKAKIFLSVDMIDGVSLDDGACRNNVLIKVPFPYLGDKRVKKRIELYGYTWANIQTARKIIQAYGRSTRSKEDWSRFHILDSDFAWFYKQNKQFFPEWFSEAIIWRKK